MEKSETINKDEGTLRFSDGVEFNTDGPLRADKRKDGWYVVGNGMLIPVDSYEEAIDMIAQMKGEKQ